jgi:hypothetical protein
MKHSFALIDYRDPFHSPTRNPWELSNRLPDHSGSYWIISAGQTRS